MSIVRWHVTMSVDGFIAGPEHAMDWVFRYDGPNPAAEAVIGSTGAILAGRGAYDAGRKPGQHAEAQEAFGGRWQGPEFVLTHRPPQDEQNPAITFLDTDIADAVAIAMDAAGGKDILVLGAGVARECVEAGLMDELLVHIAPILLGDGIRLFGDPPAGEVELELIEVSEAAPVANLRFGFVR
jgi:dihydrofolate reductase